MSRRKQERFCRSWRHEEDGAMEEENYKMMTGKTKTNGTTVESRKIVTTVKILIHTYMVSFCCHMNVKYSGSYTPYP